MNSVEPVLEHYGIKGMKWGVRRSIQERVAARQAEAAKTTPVELTIKPGKTIQSKGGKNQPASDDAIRVVTLNQKAKASGTQALTTKEMQEVVTRMNLEQQYSRLNPKAKTLGEEFLDSPFAPMAVTLGKVALKDNPDPRVKIGMMVGETLVNTRRKKK